MDPHSEVTNEFGCSSVALSRNHKPFLTYKRRRCDKPSSARKLSDPNTASNVEEKQDEEVSSEGDVPSTSSLELLTPEKLDRIAPFFKSSSSQVVTKVPFPKRTVAPGPTKRVRGQYFLDLGQADFSHTTCSSCGLVYARGLESDEKLHTSFHRSQLKGIHFKGWDHERVALRIPGKDDRVICVLPGDSNSRLRKVQEVVKVMEQELGLSEGWLWQKHCKVYLFISGSKKIVGCIVAEQITCAFPIVPSRNEDTILLQPSAPECQRISSSTVDDPCQGLEEIPASERFYRKSIESIANRHQTYPSQNPELVSITSSLRETVITQLVPKSASSLLNTDLKVVPSVLSQPNGLPAKYDTFSDSSSSLVHTNRERLKPTTRLNFGDWKFTREVVTRKKKHNSDHGNLGRAILCSKTGVPAVCGVRGIWVSRSERRKGVATHLLDAMRKTFCLGMTLKTSQCAFSQPTPDGQAFAARYCGIPTFLVYQNLQHGMPTNSPHPAVT